MTQSSTPAQLPADEQRRLSELRRYNVLNTPPAPSLDLLTRLAARIFHAPISLVSLVDANRLWFKSRQGIEVTETPRHLSFCTHAILGDEVMVVTDATSDTRFADYSLVRGLPHVRFYAGAPLRSPSGHNLGTLCIMDQKPRDLSREEQGVLAGLSKLVIDELELQLKILELNDEAERLRLTEESAQRALVRLEELQYGQIAEHLADELTKMREIHHFPRTALPSPWPDSSRS